MIASTKRQRLMWGAGILLILGFAAFDASQSIRALSFRAKDSRGDFSSYVVANHLGSVSLDDDTSGFTEDFATLNLAPGVELTDEVHQFASWLKTYNRMDGGDYLKIVRNTGHGDKVIGDAVWNDTSMQITVDDGTAPRVYTVPVTS